MLLLLFWVFFHRPVMEALAAVYRFREVISTSQESKSIGSQVIKSPRGFLGLIFLLFAPTFLSFSLFVWFSPLLCLLFLCHICHLILLKTTFPLSHFISHYPPSSLTPLPLPTHSLFLDPSPIFLLLVLSLLLRLS